MKQKDNEKFGLYIVVINITICLFMLTSDNAELSYAIVSLISSLIAILFNIKVLINAKKKTLNILSLITNITISIILIIYSINKYHLI